MMDENAKQTEAARREGRLYRSDDRERAALRARSPKRRGSGTTASSSPRRSRRCRIWSTCYRRLAARCDYPLHLGLTEAGLGMKGIVATHRRRSRFCSTRASATRFASSLTPQPGRRSHGRSARRTADPAVARAAQLHAAGHGVSRAAGARRSRSSSRWRKTSRPICASRCRSGANIIRASRRCESP